jgi:hypothetical protein
MSTADENTLRVFERKVVRMIYDPVREGDRWRIRFNREMEEIIRGDDTVTFVKSQRLAWLGHVERMDEGRMSRKLLHGKMEEKRRVRPRKRLLQDLEEDLSVMQVGRRWEKVQVNEEWRSIVREAKAHPGLQYRGRRRRGRPRKRWLQDLVEDLRVMQVGRWWEKVQVKGEWRSIVREAKAHHVL